MLPNSVKCPPPFFFILKKSGPTVTKVVTVVKTKKASPETEKKKGELMVNDQDAMEVIKSCCIFSCETPGKTMCFKRWLVSIMGIILFCSVSQSIK